MTGKQIKNHIAYADIARLLAAFSVVLLHTAGARLIALPPSGADFIVAAFYDTVTRWSVPLFVMLSGMLFLNKNKKLNVKSLWTKNIFRMVTAFVFWSWIYNVYTAYGESHNILNALKEGFFRIPKGAMHTWFIFVIVGLYIALPFIKRMTENMTKKEAEGFILISIITSFLPKTLSSFEVFSPFTQYIAKFEITIATFYVGLFVAGWYIDNFKHTKAFRMTSYLLGLGGFLYMFICTVYFSRERGAVADEFMSFKSLSAFLMAFAVMMLIKSLFGKKSFKRKTVSTLAFYSKYTFGIYLVHEMLLNISTAKGWFVFPDFPVVGIMAEAVIIFVISGVCIGIISVLPFGKYIS